MPNWKELSRPKRLELLTDLCAQKFSHREIAEILSCDRRLIHAFCDRNGIQGLSRGAQYNNTNATVTGTSRNTIMRLTRDVVLKAGRDLFLCEDCDERSDRHEWPRHHKDEDRSNNTNENIAILCNSCHAKEHDQYRSKNGLGQYA